jgi:hypothetical protein
VSATFGADYPTARRCGCKDFASTRRHFLSGPQALFTTLKHRRQSVI